MHYNNNPNVRIQPPKHVKTLAIDTELIVKYRALEVEVARLNKEAEEREAKLAEFEAKN